MSTSNRPLNDLLTWTLESLTKALLIQILILLTLIITFILPLPFSIMESLVFDPLHIDPWNGIEEYLENRNLVSLLALSSLLAKYRTSEENMKKQVSYLKERDTLITNGRKTVQREIYLEEEILYPRRDSSLDATMKKELRDIRMELSAIWDKMKRLKEIEPMGAWMRADKRNGYGGMGREGRGSCRDKNNCCAFGCGCCEKERSLHPFQKERYHAFVFSHCTDRCGCCIRREKLAYAESGDTDL